MAKRKKVIDEEFEGVSPSSTKPSDFNDLLIQSLKEDLAGSAFTIGLDDIGADVTEWLSTGSTRLDKCIYNNKDVEGGIPVGRLTEIHGDPSTGKSLLAYMILADCVRKGGTAVLIDTETSVNEDFMRMLGLDPKKNLLYVPVNTVEDVFDTIESILNTIKDAKKKNKMVCIVWDSVAATSSRKEMEEDVGDMQYALVPRLLGQGLRKVIRHIGDNRVALVFLNQMRAKIGMVFGDPMGTPGGNAIPFFASVRVRLYSGTKIKAKDGTIIGVSNKAKVIKTRFGPQFRETTVDIFFNRGLVEEYTWIKYLKDKKLLTEISSQRSSMEIDGENIGFKNKEFMDFITAPEQRILHGKIKKMIMEDMYSEPDPRKLDEDEFEYVEFNSDEQEA